MIPNLNQSRRELFQNVGLGVGGYALHSLFAQDAFGKAKVSNGLHHPATAKNVIYIHMVGGASHLDLFDYKPELQKRSGEVLEGADPKTGFFTTTGKCLGSPFEFKQHGQSGTWVSEVLPNMARHVDDMAFIYSCYSQSNNHTPAMLEMNSGMFLQGRPCVGSWVTYGLGTENQNLPGFITICPPSVHGGVNNFGSAFVPAIHQGVPLGTPGYPNALAKEARFHDMHPGGKSARQQRLQLDLLADLNKHQRKTTGTDDNLESRIQSFELAFRMQTETPQLVDLSGESQETLQLYGVNKKVTDRNGRACLLARRLSEAGVRFVQVTLGGWDHHVDIRRALPNSCAGADKPVAALITDLKRRGLLEETLVLWSGEFGRSPWSQDLTGTSPIETHGREHQQESFCAFLAGGGVKPGFSFGGTDEIGYRAVEGRVHTHDLHATILHLLGLDHEKLTYRYAGRDFRLTDVSGNVVNEIIA